MSEFTKFKSIPRYRFPKKENLARERSADPGRAQFEAGRDTIKKLITSGNYPEILSGHFFGSLVRCDGNRMTCAHANSDIDMVVFINEKIKKEDVSYHDLIKGGIKKELKEKNIKDYNSNHYSKDIFIKLISKNIIDQYLNSEQGLITTLAPMFWLSIGKGIYPYRLYLLKKLKDMGESGEDVWRKINYVISSRENMRRIPKEVMLVNYPKTLDDAIKVYGHNST